MEKTNSINTLVLPAAEPWSTEAPPLDGSLILGDWNGELYVARFCDGIWATLARDIYTQPKRWALINP